ncbi:hypothetical protein ME802_09090 [Lactobacillus delbrueckii]|nr:hypothetical protein ME802_09090 [Lactobacillus delbrueckii]
MPTYEGLRLKILKVRRKSLAKLRKKYLKGINFKNKLNIYQSPIVKSN